MTTTTTTHQWERTKWNTQRAEARERLAAQNIALAGIVLALLPTLTDPLARLRHAWSWWLSWIVASASALLVVVTIWSLVAIYSTHKRSSQLAKMSDTAMRYRSVLAEDMANRLSSHTRLITMIMAAAIGAIAIVLIGLMLAQGAFPNMKAPTSAP
jgi:hypothetical protein